MAMAAHVLDMPTQLDCHLGRIANASSTSAMIEAVQRYLASWSMERIAKVQKIDAGWAPFDLNQRPLQINGALDVRCIRDAIHCHCMALRESSVPPTPELVELEEFFFAANEMVESSKRIASAERTRETLSHRNVIANW